MIIAIASGKGGTGKTTVAVNLARIFLEPVQLLDCDVEEPNAHLFLPGAIMKERTVTVPIPEVDEALCDGCRACSELCEYNAIIVPRSKALVFPELCHSCGGCTLVCPQQAITDREQRIGTITRYQYEEIHLVRGLLDVGVAASPPMIRAVKACIDPALPVILDAPPGTSCPVVTTVRGADYVVLVTEPTPFGLHDLRLAVEMVRSLGLAFGVVINRMGIGDDRVQRYCQEEEIPIALEIADDRRIAESYSRGQLASDGVPEFRDGMVRLREYLVESAKAALPEGRI